MRGSAVFHPHPEKAGQLHGLQGRDDRVPQLVTRDEDPLELVGGEIDPRQTGAAEIDFNQLARLK